MTTVVPRPATLCVSPLSRQTHEIGIRIAVGARPADIWKMVFAFGTRLIAAGVAIGALASYSTSRYLASEVSGVSVSDPWTHAFVAITVTAAGLLACYLPARRATKVDPMTALRYE